MKFAISVLIFFISLNIFGQRHSVLVGTERQKMLEKIERNEWGAKGFEKIRQRVDTFVNLHQQDPEWILSRMAMYWKDGERYTQCYVKDEVWERGEGNAPVPTVRLPGMRVWNRYSNVPIKDRIPYNETGDMLAFDREAPGDTVKVPYQQTGHMIRSNNNEILDLAIDAAFIYWLTREEKYAKFSGDIFNQWLTGTYYMKPPVSIRGNKKPVKAYEPSDISGYYDYEQIHDDLGMKGATIYDFLYDYLEQHPTEEMKATGKTVKDLTGEVLKRFIDTGMVRGRKTGNWNVNGWQMMMRPILVLENDEFYEDGKGRNHYLNYFINESTAYHDALPDILKVYDPVTGLWPESPGYGFSTLASVLEMASMINRSGEDVIMSNPIIQKAALSMLPWMDSNGNMIVFGDYRGGAANYYIYELLHNYYKSKGDAANTSTFANVIDNAIKNGSYKRIADTWEKLMAFENLDATNGMEMKDRASYSPFHRVGISKTAGKPGLMAVLYGGRDGSHLSKNGLALQVYGNGYALAPDASNYESYWSEDYKYHQGATGSNTIMPGYIEGEIEIKNMEPSVPEGKFSVSSGVNPMYGVMDFKSGEKRRAVFTVAIDSVNGYYLDIFRSAQQDNDYVFHGLGKNLTLQTPKGFIIHSAPIDSLPNPKHQKGYGFFKDTRKWFNDNDIVVCDWEIGSNTPVKKMRLWQVSSPYKDYYTMLAPSTNPNAALSPGGVSTGIQPTPVLLVRQNGVDGEALPFVSVIEPVIESPVIDNVELLYSDASHILLKVRTKTGITDYIITSEEGTPFVYHGIKLDGYAGIIRTDKGQVKEMYLVNGKELKTGKTQLVSKTPKSISKKFN